MRFKKKNRCVRTSVNQGGKSKAEMTMNIINVLLPQIPINNME